MGREDFTALFIRHRRLINTVASARWKMRQGWQTVSTVCYVSGKPLKRLNPYYYAAELPRAAEIIGAPNKRRGAMNAEKTHPAKSLRLSRLCGLFCAWLPFGCGSAPLGQSVVQLLVYFQ